MLRIAIPNKGRLADQTLTLFEKAGLKAESRVDRALVANLGSEFQAIFVRAQDIPEFVADGAADLGVTGSDLVEESGQSCQELLDLEYGRCRLAVAVREESQATDPRGPRARDPGGHLLPRITKSYFDRLAVESRSRPLPVPPKSPPIWVWPTSSWIWYPPDPPSG